MCVTTTKDIIPLYYSTWICAVIRKSPQVTTILITLCKYNILYTVFLLNILFTAQFF